MYRTSAAIITAVQVETDYVMRLYDNWEKIKISEDNQEYFSASFTKNSKPHRIITAQQNTMGMTAAALLSAKMIHEFRPEYLIMCGIAAGLGQDSEQIYGDIIVPDIVWDYSSGKFIAPEFSAIKFGRLGFMPRPKFIKADEAIINIVKGLQGNTDYKFFVGPMACGSAVVANREVIESQIHSFMPDTIGLDMESYGVLYTAKNATSPRPKAAVIKSICDYADHQKSDQYQKFAAYTSSMFTKELLENHLPFTV